MSIKFFFLRMVNTRFKRILLLFFLFFPLVELFLGYRYISVGAQPLSPEWATFLCGYLDNSGFRPIIWYLPLYFLFLAGDSFIEDYHYKYDSLLWMRNGRKSYIPKALICGFLTGFTVMIISLLVNYMFAHILYNGGPGFPAGDDLLKPISWFPDPVKHKSLVNLFHIAFTSLLAGVTSTGAASLSLLLHNRFLVYPLVFAGWYIPFSFRNSIIFSIQPFTEYSLADATGAIIFVFVFNFLSVAVLFTYQKCNVWWRASKKGVLQNETA